jgi:hypothetical protein
MNCPKCNTDLSELENYDNINQFHNCLECGVDLYLDYDEWCAEDYSECWDLFEWKLKETIKDGK